MREPAPTCLFDHAAFLVLQAAATGAWIIATYFGLHRRSLPFGDTLAPYGG